MSKKREDFSSKQMCVYSSCFRRFFKHNLLYLKRGSPRSPILFPYLISRSPAQGWFSFLAARISLPPCLRVAHKKSVVSAYGSASSFFTPSLCCIASDKSEVHTGSRLVLETGTLRLHGMLRVINTLCPYTGLV
jgi:hypothetical protein